MRLAIPFLAAVLLALGTGSSWAAAATRSTANDQLQVSATVVNPVQWRKRGLAGHGALRIRPRQLPRYRGHGQPWKHLPGRQYANFELTKSGESALRFLSPREREAIYLRFFQDAAYEDVAAIMRINESTSRVLVRRALDKLRDRLMRKEAKRETQ